LPVRLLLLLLEEESTVDFRTIEFDKADHNIDQLAIINHP
jgi:hypothetical protein